MSSAVIHVQDVSFAYKGALVLEDVSLRMERGEFLVIIGPNGGGKTTLIRLLLGMVKPKLGSVRLFGASPAAGRSRVGYVPQLVHGGSGVPVSVRDCVLMGLTGKNRCAGLGCDKDEAIHNALRAVRMADFSDHSFAELSGGQRQRVALARALVSRPELLLLDEPMSNIDPEGRFCLYDLLREVGQETSIVLISHDVGMSKGKSVTGMAAVNKRVLSCKGSTPTREMMELLYGRHDHDCMVDNFMYKMEEGPVAADMVTKP
jgi:zinc transport system ATP-binding protein